MFFYLSRLSESFGPLRLFEYVTFRAGGAALTAFLLVTCFGGSFAKMLRSLNLRAAGRYEGLIPEELLDKRKNSTPCMGGILLVGAVAAASLLWLRMGDSGIGITLLAGTIGFALIGFVDDAFKVFRQDRDGLHAKFKLFLQFLVAAIVVFALHQCPTIRTLMKSFYLPFVKEPLCIGQWWVPVFSVLVMVGICNAVNFTDGKDGLASGCTIFCTLTYAVFTYLMGHRVLAGYLSVPYTAGIEEAVVFSSAIGGACIGFLWHNCHPAAMFMGDTGSLALGGAVGMLGVLSRQEVLLFLVGGVFVMEIGSVMLQVASFKLTGKRIFLCSPIHHHFERLGWTETQIVVRFWILSGIFSLMALATLKLR